MKRNALLLFIILGLVFAQTFAASTRGTAAEARTMVARAAEHYKAVGRAKALADFNAGKAPFRDRDLYVVCIASDGTIAANGAFPTYVGMSADVLRDADKKPLGHAILALGAKKGPGSITFPMINPVTKKIEAKTFFGEKLDRDVCGVGAYTPN
ncbi:MAG TPA: histidine kinase [Thermoanaerobaculia bacterium]|nr:histidine kinase [Thermoanaerobaculia bacterium]